jgi:Rrf2 family protein
MPERFLLQVLRNLVTHGILRSTRGVDGGYSLDRNAEEISLLEVMEAIEGPHGSGIPEGDGFSEQAQQTLRAALAQVADTTRSQLAAIKLSSLIPSPAAQGDKAEATA